MEIAARRDDDWMGKPSGTLARLIQADQFPCNAFRRFQL